MTDQTGSAPEPRPNLLLVREVVDAAGRMRHGISRRSGLSTSELDAIQHLLAQSEQPIGPAELSRRLDVTSAAATQISDRLVGRGHVERTADPHDRRRTRLVVTPSGRSEVLEHLRPMLEGLAEHDEGFSEEERAVVERYLRGVVTVLDRVAEG